MVEAFFRDGSFFMTEASLMLADELRVDSHHYAFLLTEIAKGVTKREDLQKRLADVQVGGYLDRLQFLYGMVKKVEPVVPMGYRRARYDLEDPYLLFWHAFVAENADLVSAHRFDELKRRFYERWDDFSVRFRIRWFREKIRESCVEKTKATSSLRMRKGASPGPSRSSGREEKRTRFRSGKRRP